MVLQASTITGTLRVTMRPAKMNSGESGSKDDKQHARKHRARSTVEALQRMDELAHGAISRRVFPACVIACGQPSTGSLHYFAKGILRVLRRARCSTLNYECRIDIPCASLVCLEVDKHYVHMCTWMRFGLRRRRPTQMHRCGSSHFSKPQQ